MEKPTKVEVGQRWSNPKCSPKYNPQTVTEAREYCEDGNVSGIPGFILLLPDGSTRHWPACDILEWTYLGPASPPSVLIGPTPWKVGQRRRGPIYVGERNRGHNHFEGEYVVHSLDTTSMGIYKWRVKCADGEFHLANETWPSELVDSGSPALSPTAATAGESGASGGVNGILPQTWKVGQQWKRGEGSVWTVDSVDDKGIGMHENGRLVHDGQPHSQWHALRWANDKANAATWTLVSDAPQKTEPETNGEAPDALLSRLREENATLRAEVAALREPFGRKPKAEPWVPSVTDEDLLPDAGR